jgi:signal peptidase I
MDPKSFSPNNGNQPEQPIAPTQPPVSPASPTKSPEAPGMHRYQGLKDVLSIVGVLLSALVLAFGLISFVFQSYQVDGPSMQTTLENNDHLVVWKIPRTWARITKHAYVPNRGDIIVFNEPGLADYGQSGDKQLIKRVIGLPGDRVVVKNGALTIYNTTHPDGFKPDKTMPYGKVIPTTSGNVDLTLNKNQIFVCGDNRPNSLDSRVFGPVTLNNVVGKLALRILPLNDAKVF